MPIAKFLLEVWGLHQDVVLQSHSMIYLVLVGKFKKKLFSFLTDGDEGDDADHENSEVRKHYKKQLTHIENIIKTFQWE